MAKTAEVCVRDMIGNLSIQLCQNVATIDALEEALAQKTKELEEIRGAAKAPKSAE